MTDLANHEHLSLLAAFGAKGRSHEQIADLRYVFGRAGFVTSPAADGAQEG